MDDVRDVVPCLHPPVALLSPALPAPKPPGRAKREMRGSAMALEKLAGLLRCVQLHTFLSAVGLRDESSGDSILICKSNYMILYVHVHVYLKINYYI